MNHILLRKQDSGFLITKSLNHYPNIKTQTSDEVQTLSKYENSTVVFDDVLLSKQESNIDLFFTKGRHNNINIHYFSHIYFHLRKKIIRNSFNINIFFKQTLKISYYYFMIWQD